MSRLVWMAGETAHWAQCTWDAPERPERYWVTWRRLPVPLLQAVSLCMSKAATMPVPKRLMEAAGVDNPGSYALCMQKLQGKD